MKTVQVGFEFAHEILLRPFGGRCVAETETVRDTEDMGIDGHEVGAGVFDEDHVGGFLSDAGEFDQLLFVERNFTSVFLHHHFRHRDEIFGFVVEKRAGFDVLFDLFRIGLSEGGGIGVFFEKCRGDEVDPLVGTLS